MSEPLLTRLDRNIHRQVRSIEQSDVYRLIAEPTTEKGLVVAIIRSILLEVFSYGPHVTEATFTAIGRMPKDRPDLMRPMILHDLSEVDHGEMALKDFVRLGGDEEWARTRRMTPASLAMAATCRMLAERESPFSYLGYMYLFEALTPVLTERAQIFLEAHGFPTAAREFIDVHATEDIGHRNALGKLINTIAAAYPAEEAAIEYGFDCFAVVYPLPIWEAALARARQDVAVATTR